MPQNSGKHGTYVEQQIITYLAAPNYVTKNGYTGKHIGKNICNEKHVGTSIYNKNMLAELVVKRIHKGKHFNTFHSHKEKKNANLYI